MRGAYSAGKRNGAFQAEARNMLLFLPARVGRSQVARRQEQAIRASGVAGARVICGSAGEMARYRHAGGTGAARAWLAGEVAIMKQAGGRQAGGEQVLW